MEKHPQVVASVEDKLRSLIGVYGNAVRRIREVIPESDRLTRALQIAQDVFKEQKAELVLNTRSAEFMAQVLARLTDEEERVGSQGEQLASKLAALGKFTIRVGYRMGWFAFRTMVVGRILLSWMLKPLRMGIRALTNWESSLDRAASALGLLAASGMLTTRRADILYNSILKLAKAGPEVQGAFQYLQSVLASIAVDAIQPFIPMILKLADTIAALWEEVSPKLIPALETLVDQVFPPLIELIQRVGPAIVEGFVQGLSIALPFIINFLGALEPILPVIAQLIGFLLPFAPILVGIGAALYVLSPILTAVGTIMQVLSFILSGAVIPALGAFLSALAPLLPVLLPLIAVIAAAILVWKNWGAIVNWFKSVTKPLQPLFNVLKELFGAVIHVLTGLGKIFYNLGRIIYELIRIGLTKLWEVLEPVRKLFVDIANAIGIVLEPVIQSITNAIKPLVDMLNALGDALHGVGDFLSGVADGLAQLCFRHIAPQVALFTKRMNEAKESIAGVQAGLIGLGGGLTGLAAPGLGVRGGTQEVTIYADISIGSGTAEADLDRIVDAVNEGLTEALRRRFLS